MDVKALLKHYGRYKWLIISVPLLSVIVTFFLVRDLPKEYVSQAQLATGLTDESQRTADSQNLDYFRVTTQFGNIMEMMRSRTVLSTLTNGLMLHDLESRVIAFQPWSDLLQKLSPQDRGKAAAYFRQKLISKEPLTLDDNRISGLPLYDVAKSMGYDERGLLKNLNIRRLGESDFINIEFTSTNPELSAYVVNTLAREFLAYYTHTTFINQRNSLSRLDSLLKEKERVMVEKNTELKNYKVNSGVLNLDKQSDVIYTQISQVEAKRAETIGQIQSLKGALKAINAKLAAGGEASIGGTSLEENNEIINLENQLKIANQQYINNNFRREDKQTIDSLTALRRLKIAAASDKYITSPASVRKELNDQRMKLETDLALAQNSISTIEGALATLRGRYSALVPTDAGVQKLERDADVATKEYMDALARYNQTSVEKNTTAELVLAQPGLLGTPEPSKRFIYVGLAGFAGLSLCLAILTLSFVLDKTIRTPQDLKAATGVRVVGGLNCVKEKNKDLRDIWEDDATVPDYGIYKDFVRSLRFEVDRELTAVEGKVLGITSIYRESGKTFLSAGLAYAFAMTGRKVLLISEYSPSLASMICNGKEQPMQRFESFLVKKEIKVEDLITVLNRNAGGKSLLEMKDANSLVAGFSYLKDKFDLIIIDMDSLQDMNRVKEWMMFVSKCLLVIEAGTKLDDHGLVLLERLKKEPSLLGTVLNKVLLNRSA
ncbi:lipopolysaccharide biosynthesis protein [Olivibacter sp. XZL3]|uniref:exopolysaccharide transport family protein n=1 Tax=Olivibacter sp. XZL3 TaxID=1735116 RepID=UPI00106643C8|nr:lipopolysaccharide biosynthesis protein [Olivibacter sp. XZL3]